MRAHEIGQKMVPDIYAEFSDFYDFYVGDWLEDLPFYLYYAQTDLSTTPFDKQIFLLLVAYIQHKKNATHRAA